MSRALVAASALISVASLGVALWALDEARTARTGAPGPAGPAGVKGASLEARVARLEEQNAPAPQAAVASASPSSHADPAARAALDAPPPEEGLRTLVRETVQQEFEARTKQEEEVARSTKAAAPEGDGRKPPLSQIAAELDLDEAQREAVHEAVRRGQEESIALLKTPTAGGRVPLDDLVKAILSKPEEAKQSMIEIFGMLATEKVPGSGETYAQKFEGLKKATSEQFRRTFTAEQFKAYEKTGQDPLEIQIPDSPWIQVLQEAWKRNR